MENNYGSNGKAIASLVVSCVSVLCCCIWYISILCGVISIVLGILALRGDNKRHQDLAVAGIVVGSTGTAIGIASAVLYIMMIYSAQGNQPPALQDGSDTVLMAVRNMMHYIK